MDKRPNYELIENALIEFGGIGSRTDVKNKINALVVFIEPLGEFSPIDQGGISLPLIVGPFIHPFEIIHRNDIIITLFVQGAYQTTSYESGSTGNDDHKQFFCEYRDWNQAAPSLRYGRIRRRPEILSAFAISLKLPLRPSSICLCIRLTFAQTF
jgi:hypothetical protein